MIKYVRFLQLPSSEWIKATDAFCLWGAKNKDGIFEYKFYDDLNFEQVFTFFEPDRELFKKYLRQRIIILGELIAEEDIDERIINGEFVFECKINELNVLTDINMLDLSKEENYLILN